MTGELWAQIGFAGAFFSLAAFVLQASIRGTWRPAAWTKELLESKDELLRIKDGQIGLLSVEKEAWKSVAEKQTQQISLFAESSLTAKHFFQEVPVVPSKGDTDDEEKA